MMLSRYKSETFILFSYMATVPLGSDFVDIVDSADSVDIFQRLISYFVLVSFYMYFDQWRTLSSGTNENI